MSYQIIRLEKQPRKNGGPRNVRVYLCAYCGLNEAKLRGKKPKANEPAPCCPSCGNQKRPFESIYNGLSNDHRRIPVDLTYEEYLEFTKIPDCHYCEDGIPWSPYGCLNGKFISRAYYLDRKDNSLGYSAANCVVCCTECNKMRSNRFTYEEFCQIGEALKQIRLVRANDQDQASRDAEGMEPGDEGSKANNSKAGSDRTPVISGYGEAG